MTDKTSELFFNLLNDLVPIEDFESLIYSDQHIASEIGEENYLDSQNKYWPLLTMKAQE